MPDPKFTRDTAVTRTGDRAFEAHIDPGWWIVNGPNGGYVAAILLRALTHTVDDPERAPRSFTAHFTAPPAAGPVRLETRVERTGRSLTSLSAFMWQGDRLCALAMAAYSRPRARPEFHDARCPRVEPPEACVRLGDIMEGTIPLRAQYDQRVVSPGFAPPELQAVTGGWTRLVDPCPADAHVIAAYADSWPPPIFRRPGADGKPMFLPNSTIDLTVHFRCPLPLADDRPDAYYLTLFTTRVAGDGFVDEDGEVWSADGRLLAQSRQLAAIL